MKLALTKKYVQELSEKYCQTDKEYISGYGVNRMFFNWFAPQPRVMFFNEEEVIVLILNKFTLNVSKEQRYPIAPTTKLEFNKGVMMNKLKIVDSGNVVFKTLINKKLVGFGDMQNKCNQYLEQMANK